MKKILLVLTISLIFVCSTFAQVLPIDKLGMFAYNDEKYSPTIMCATSSTINNKITILGVDNDCDSSYAVAVVEGVGYDIIQTMTDGLYGMVDFKGLEKGKEYTYYVVSVCKDGSIRFSEKDEFIF